MKTKEEKPDWIKEEEARVYAWTVAHLASLIDYYCPDCGIAKLSKSKGERIKWCAACIKFRGWQP